MIQKKKKNWCESWINHNAESQSDCRDHQWFQSGYEKESHIPTRVSHNESSDLREDLKLTPFSRFPVNETALPKLDGFVSRASISLQSYRLYTLPWGLRLPISGTFPPTVLKSSMENCTSDLKRTKMVIVYPSLLLSDRRLSKCLFLNLRKNNGVSDHRVSTWHTWLIG